MRQRVMDKAFYLKADKKFLDDLTVIATALKLKRARVVRLSVAKLARQIERK